MSIGSVPTRDRQHLVTIPAARAGAESAHDNMPVLDGDAEGRGAGQSLVDRRQEAGPRRWSRPSATFLAHLIATAQQAPQTRERRRCEPGDAVARYAESLRDPVATGRWLRRSV